VRLLSRLPQATVLASHGLVFAPDGAYQPGADLLLVPGGRWASRHPVGAWGEVQRGEWLPLLAEAAARGTVMASVCTGALLLAHAGVIGGRRATTHHSAWDDLTATGGVTSGIDLALWLVERYCSAEVADAVADAMEHTRWRPEPG
jgi:transcriptional regulator GlxA family with amidase domain